MAKSPPAPLTRGLSVAEVHATRRRDRVRERDRRDRAQLSSYASVPRGVSSGSWSKRKLGDSSCSEGGGLSRSRGKEGLKERDRRRERERALLLRVRAGGRGVSIGVWNRVERKRRPGKGTDSVVFLWHKGPRSSLTESLVL